jgi:exodeoxyribonuclease V beta subunit
MRLMAVPGGPMKAGPARRFIAEQTACEIARLLTYGQEQRLLLHDRPLVPADIAVLVRSHREGRLMREALAACGIRSVEYTQDSLFDSEEARELEAILSAIADPGDRNALPTALATTLMGQSAATVLAVKEGEEPWEIWYQRFLHFQELWRQQGVAAMLQHLLYEPLATDSALAETMLMAEGGERRLTNVLHLIEVLQETANQEQLAAGGLVKWLGRQRDESLRIGEARELRLESDEGLVKIITVHKSKGLQYPIVFCPFLWGTRPSESAPFTFHTEKGDAALELGSRDLPDYEEDYRRHQRLAKAEAEQEEMRLLYVALTRAQYQCHIAFGAIGGNSKPADSAKSVLARLLRLEDGDFADSDSIAAAMERLGADQPDDFDVLRLPRPPARFAVEAEQAALEARPFNGRIARDWHVTSYSTLSRGRPERVLRADDDHAVIATAGGPQADDFFGFTRGRQAGSFLHAVLEGIDFSAVDVAQLQMDIERLAPRYGIDGEQWGEVVQEAILRIIATPLNAEGLSLGSVPRQDRLPELEFHYSLDGARSGLLRFLERSGVAAERWEEPLRLLEQAPGKGLMTGFIDLTFRHDGKYYLLDYKSNHLGDSYADYAPEHMAQAMTAEAFDLQYLIYTLALHRYLRVRLPGYDYEKDIGGVFYLFLRGMHPDHPGSGVFFDRPPKRLILALDRYLLGELEDA